MVTITQTNNVGYWLARARQKLVRTSENPSLEAQLLAAHTTGQPRAWIMAHLETHLSPMQWGELEKLLIQRQAGEPLPYLLGHWEFYGLDFVITPAVLIPRPETELLVDVALHWLPANPGRHFVADVWTGSGCIAVALAHCISDLNIVATDLSYPALIIARQNACKHSPESQILFVQSNLLQTCRGPFDLVCANLPYIPTRTLSGLEVAQYEPHLALDGGEDGLVLIRDLLQDTARWLSPGGLLLLEIEADQGESVPALASSFFPGAEIQVTNDLAGKARLVMIQRPGKPSK